MINPFRSEARAFHFLLGVVAYCLAIGLAATAGGFWAALIVCIVLGAVAVVWWLRAGRPQRPRVMHQSHPSGERRILVVANEAVGGDRLRRLVEQRTRGLPAEVLVIAPALTSPLRFWASDEDGARAAAWRRLAASLHRLHPLGIRTRGEIGDADPLQAIEDALRTFSADEIIVSTHPAGRSNWLERDVVERARARFAVPLTHVVADAKPD